ncbi:hypothetical protein GW17_00036454 [Ensete ventricosum]|nr:hypothetical protein GW17_00036454 [Ensete ventricosum]
MYRSASCPIRGPPAIRRYHRNRLFGVVLLELLTGWRSVDKTRPSKEQSLVDWARPKLNDKRKLLQIIDTRLEDQYSVRAAQKACSLAYYCLSHNPKARPLMSDVVETLEPLQVSSGSEGLFQAVGSSGISGYKMHRRLAGSGGQVSLSFCSMVGRWFIVYCLLAMFLSLVWVLLLPLCFDVNFILLLSVVCKIFVSNQCSSYRSILAYRDLAGTVRYGSVTIDFDRYRVCSSYRLVQDGPRTSKPLDRYVPPIPGGTENLGFNCTAADTPNFSLEL